MGKSIFCSYFKAMMNIYISQLKVAAIILNLNISLIEPYTPVVLDTDAAFLVHMKRSDVSLILVLALICYALGHFQEMEIPRRAVLSSTAVIQRRASSTIEKTWRCLRYALIE